MHVDISVINDKSILKKRIIYARTHPDHSFVTMYANSAQQQQQQQPQQQQLPPFRDLATHANHTPQPVAYLDRPDFGNPLSHRGDSSNRGGGNSSSSNSSMMIGDGNGGSLNTAADMRYAGRMNPKLYPDNTVPPSMSLSQRPGGDGDSGGVHQSLSGQTLSASQFTHNNMMPFYGSNVQQNLNPHAGAMRLEVHTGVSAVRQHKETRSPFFSPTKGHTHVHGTPNMSEEMRTTRFEESKSKFRQGEKPVQDINVGPGLGKGFTSTPSGGYHHEMRDYVMPKTVDELRAKTNPKVTYTNPVIRGRALNTKAGKHGAVSKNTPENFYVNSPARYNTTVGIVKGRKLRTMPVDRPTHRHSTLRGHTGNAGQFTHEGSRPDEYVRTAHPFKSETHTKSAGFRNANDAGTWGNIEAFTGDYGKQGIEVLPNERDTTQLASYLSNAASFVKAMVAPVTDLMRTTRKENVIGNPRLAGNMGGNIKKQPVYDPNDVAKTTLKETNIHDTRTGGMSGTSRHAATVYDPNDVARTTIKETNIHDARTGNLHGPRKLATYDPNDIARTTLKETNIHDTRTGNINDRTRHAATVYDPNDVARTTLKETNIHDVRTGNINDLSRHALPAYDPNDIARTTIKETNVHDSRSGNMGMHITKLPAYDPNDVAKTTTKETNIHDARTGNMSSHTSRAGVLPQPDDAKTTVRETLDDEDTAVNLAGRVKATVYDPNDVLRVTIKETNIDHTRQGNVTGVDTKGGYTTNPADAPNTNRQFTSDVEYSGVAEGPGEGGYKVTPTVAPATQRHELSDTEYAGVADSRHKAPTSYENAYNATTDEFKEKVAEGRQPTLSGAKQSVGKTFVQMEQKDDHDRENHRDTISTRVGEQLPPDLSRCSVTKDKLNLALEPERNQPDPALVSALAGNPFTQSLNSSA
jgi:hypothetical protein